METEDLLDETQLNDLQSLNERIAEHDTSLKNTLKISLAAQFTDIDLWQRQNSAIELTSPFHLGSDNYTKYEYSVSDIEFTKRSASKLQDPEDSFNFS